MSDLLDLCLTVSTYVNIAGMLLAAWMLRTREPCLGLFFLMSSLAYLCFLAFDIARDRGMLSLEAYRRRA